MLTFKVDIVTFVGGFYYRIFRALVKFRRLWGNIQKYYFKILLNYEIIVFP